MFAESKKFTASFLLFLTAIMIFTSVLSAYEPQYRDYEYRAGVPNTGVMDFSWLNEKPAGTHGAVTVKDGDFVFEDGTKVRFWGVDMGFNAATPDKEVAEKIAAELASSGVNFVRLHAIDCTYSGIVDFTGYTEGQPTGAIIEENLDKMDWLIYCLKENGIYIHLDTSAGRVLSVGDGFTEEEVQYLQDATLRGYQVFVDRIAEKELDFVKTLMGHLNPYTNMKYCDDPVFAVVQMMNESSILWLQNGNVSNVLTKQLDIEFNAWLAEKYGTREKLEEAWGTALWDFEDPADTNINGYPLNSWSEYHISADSNTAPRQADWVEFLMDKQKTVFGRFYDTLREMGYKGAINCSNYPTGPQDLYLNSLGDVTEKNVYFGSSDDYSLPTYVSSEIMTEAAAKDTMQAAMTTASVADKATVITEWQVLSHTEFKADAVFQVACYAALQDWDGFCMFNYSFDGTKSFLETDSYTDFYAFHMDPNSYGEFGMCAAIFRLGLISEAENSIEYVYTKSDSIANNTNLGRDYLKRTIYISKSAYRFLEDGEKYDGNADLVIASGNLADGDYTAAKHLLIPTAMKKTSIFSAENTIENWLSSYLTENSAEVTIGRVKLMSDNQYAVNLKSSAGEGATFLTGLMRHFGLIGEDRGYLNSSEMMKYVSDTGELVFDEYNENFSARAESVAVMTGKPLNGKLSAGNITFSTENDLLALGVLAADRKPIEESESLFIYNMARSTGKSMEWNHGILTSFGTDGIIVENVSGTLTLPVQNIKKVNVYGLDADGKRVSEIENVKVSDGYAEIVLDGFCYYEIEEIHGAFNIMIPIIAGIAGTGIIAVALVIIIRKKKRV